MRHLNVFSLGRFITSAEQQNNFTGGFSEINAISGSVIDFQLKDSRANGLAGSKISQAESRKPCIDDCLGLGIAE